MVNRLVADDILDFFYHVLETIRLSILCESSALQKIRLDISCESFTRQTINMTYQVLFSLFVCLC